jgi:hypothetical protein
MFQICMFFLCSCIILFECYRHSVCSSLRAGVSMDLLVDVGSFMVLWVAACHAGYALY